MRIGGVRVDYDHQFRAKQHKLGAANNSRTDFYMENCQQSETKVNSPM